MGHRVNANSLRLGITRFWKSNIFYRNVYEQYNEFKTISRYFLIFFCKKDLLICGITYSHVNILLVNSDIKIDVILYSFNRTLLIERLKKQLIKENTINLFKLNLRKINRRIFLRNYLKRNLKRGFFLNNYENLEKLTNVFLQSNYRTKKLLIKNLKKKKSQLNLENIFSNILQKKIKKKNEEYFFKLLIKNYLINTEYFLIKELENNIKKTILREKNNFINVKIDFTYIVGSSLTAETLVRYVTYKLKLKYSLGELIYPLMIGIKKYFLGVVLKCSGRFTRIERGQIKVFKYGKVPLNTISKKIDYSFAMIKLKYGACGIKIWLCKERIRKIKIKKVSLNKNQNKIKIKFEEKSKLVIS
jgi:ribosomal protein S3